MKLGLIGLGTMGFPIAINLLRKGFELHVYDVAKEKVQSIVSQGAIGENSSTNVAKASDVVLLSLPSQDVSERILLAEDGILNTIKKGGVIVELSTVTPSFIRWVKDKAEKRGIEVLDAPVSGGKKGAERASLTIMVGGKREVFRRCLPVFKSIGDKIYYAGSSGSGEAIKLLNSLLAIGNLMLAREAIILARSQGVDIPKMYEVVNSSTGQSWMWSNWVAELIEGKRVGSTPRIMIKDLNYAINMSKDNMLSLPLAERVLDSVKSQTKDSSLDEDVALLFRFASGNQDL